MKKEYKYTINGNKYEVAIGDVVENMVTVNVNGEEYKVEMEPEPEVEKVVVKMTMRVGDNGRVFGSINSKDVAEALVKLHQEEPTPTMRLRLHCQVSSQRFASM